MGWQDRIAVLFSPIHTQHDHSHVSNHYELKPHIHHETKNEYHINSTQTKVLSISGSNNQGMMLNDAKMNLTTLIDRPIFFQWNQPSLFLYIMVIAIVLMIGVLVLACSHQQRDKRRHGKRRKRRRTARSVNESTKPLDVPVPQSDEAYDILTESTTQWAHDKIMQYMSFHDIESI